MTRTILIAVVICGIVLGLVITLVLVNSSPAITLDDLKASRFEDGIMVSFRITNRTPHPYTFVSPTLEARDGTTWRVVPDGVYSSATADGVNGHSATRGAWFCKRLPSGPRLRLRVQTQRCSQGFASLWIRAKMRLSGGYPISLSPLDRTWVFTRDADVTTEEFTEP